MACCAFAIFLLGQLYGLFETARRWLHLRRVEATIPAGAAGWRLNTTPPPIPLRPRSRHKLAYAVSAAGLAILAASQVQKAHPHVLEAFLEDSSHWCGKAAHP